MSTEHSKLNPLSSSVKTLLEEHFQGLHEIQDNLVEQAVDFVLHGTHEEVLHLFARNTKAHEYLKIKVTVHNRLLSQVNNKNLFDVLSANPMGCFRLAQLYETASRAAKRELTMTWGNGIPAWLEVLLWQASPRSMGSYSNDQRAGWLSHSTINQILQCAGEPTDLVLRLLLFPKAQKAWNDYLVERLLQSIPALAAVAHQYIPLIHEALTQPSAENRIHVIEILSKAGCSVTDHLQDVILLALDSAKTVRQAAESWLISAVQASIPLLQEYAQSGTAKQRTYAIDLLWRIGKEDQRAFLQQLTSTEKTASVLQTIHGILLQTTDHSQILATRLKLDKVSIGPLPPFSKEAKTVLACIAENLYKTATNQKNKFQKNIQSPLMPSDKDLDEWISLLSEKDVTISKFSTVHWKPHLWAYIEPKNDFKEFITLQEVTLGHIIRLAGLIHILYEDEESHQVGNIWRTLRFIESYKRIKKADFGLREVAVELAAIGINDSMIGIEPLYGYHQRWKPEQIWPYFVERIQILEKALGLHPNSHIRHSLSKELRLQALDIIAMMPYPPPSLHSSLWNIAFGTVKAERALAQKAASKIPDFEKKVFAALQDKNENHREIAASWLANNEQSNRSHKLIISSLKNALKKEKKDRAKVAMMQALESLEVSVDEFLDRKGLQAEAESGLKKGIPAALSWFPFEKLPDVHWVDSSKKNKVSRDILIWWIIQSQKLGNPEPSPLLKRYAVQLDSTEANTFAQFILEAWLHRDTELPTPEEAEAKAAEMNDGYKPDLALQFLKIPKQSAIQCKGILAVVAMAAKECAAPLVSRYLKEWYGARASQCKSLLQMLSFIDHPSAIQLLLQISTRFRTPGIRKFAESCISEIAERKNWTLHELSDRTISHAGLDQQGSIELSYGKRSFTAQLQSDLTLMIQSSDGKSIKNVPEPKSDDDPHLAKEAKNRLSTIKKEIKTVAQQQKERLYEAMCEEKTWRFSDWKTYLLEHPIMGLLCQRVVWMLKSDPTKTKNDKKTDPIVTFRPLGDGTLSSCDDTLVHVPQDSWIGIAHPLFLSESQISAWIEHLADYEVPSLFQQFSRKPYQLPPEKQLETKLSDFQGHVLETFALRGRATKLGYIRGQTVDSGWFYSYVRHFPGLGITAEIYFTGNFLPEENRKIALIELQFQKNNTESIDTDDDHFADTIIPLAEIPMVLLSEAWNDLRDIAAEGAGFDPDWKKILES